MTTNQKRFTTYKSLSPVLTTQTTAQHGLDRVDLLKMDCEGSEYSILYRCTTEYLKRIGKMAIEVHAGQEPDHNITALSSFLAARGFSTHTAGYMLWAVSPD